MRSERFNIFNQIHKGLRAMLYDAAMATQHTNFRSPAEAEPTLHKLEQVILLFEKHAKGEDETVFPPVAYVAPSAVEELEKEHVRDHELSVGLEYWIRNYRESRESDERFFIGVKILQGLNAFIAFNLDHMNKEETIINELLWDHYGDEQLLDIEKEVVSKNPPEVSMLAARWMLAGMGNHEISKWMIQVKKNAPPMVYAALWQLAGEVMTPSSWAVVSAVAPLPALVA